MHAMTEPQNEYQRDAARYLQTIVALFGDYKRRSFAFLLPEPGQTVVEVGCGTGEDALALAGVVGPSGRVVAIDPNEALLAGARDKAAAAGVTHIDWISGGLPDLPLPDASCDRARADRVFQHLPDLPAALAGMIRVVKPGGWVSVLDVDWGSLRVDAADPARTAALLALTGRVVPHADAGTRLYGLFRRAGLAGVEVYAETVCVRDWPVARMIWGLDTLAAKAAEAGLVTAGEAEEWVADLVARHEAGAFFASITGFVVRGQVAA
jgi:SAM-dependent methyltransferase